MLWINIVKNNIMHVIIMEGHTKLSPVVCTECYQNIIHTVSQYIFTSPVGQVGIVYTSISSTSIVLKRINSYTDTNLGFLKLFGQCGQTLACFNWWSSMTPSLISLTLDLSVADSISSFSDSCMLSLGSVLASWSACSSLICTRLEGRVRRCGSIDSGSSVKTHTSVSNDNKWMVTHYQIFYRETDCVIADDVIWRLINIDFDALLFQIMCQLPLSGWSGLKTNRYIATENFW